MGSAARIPVLIVDDHAVVRQGLRMFLQAHPDLEVVGEASNGQEALRLTERLRPKVVLMDLVMPVMDGTQATAEIRTRFPDTEVLVLTSVLEDKSVVGAMRAGATGYLLKNSDADHLARAIRAAAEGRVELAPEAAARLVREIKEPVTEQLTARETELLRLVALGKANKEVARELRISDETVKTHLSNIFSKLGVRSRTQAALHAAKLGLVSPSDLERA